MCDPKSIVNIRNPVKHQISDITVTGKMVKDYPYEDWEALKVKTCNPALKIAVEFTAVPTITVCVLTIDVCHL